MTLYHLKNDGIERIESIAFESLGVRERLDLQRILRSKVDVIAPDCKVIAEEFCWWDDSRQRIDLLAIDRSANLVVIELKRSEDAGHIELQALRYAAMVSTMSFEQAVDAHAEHLRKIGSDEDARGSLLQFLEWEDPQEHTFGDDVRLILVSADFSKEITTTVMWLNERDVDIRCVRMQPHLFHGEVVVDVQQVIPLPEAEEYQVRVRARNEARRAAAVRESERDHTKFDVTIAGRTETRLYKRKAVLSVFHGLAAAGISPEQMKEVVPTARRDRLFICAPGELNEEEFGGAVIQHMHDRIFDPTRWFCDDGDLVHMNGRTYAVSNQWGLDTADTIRSLVTAFPDAHIAVSQSEA